MMLGLRRINDVWLIEKRRVLVIQSHLRGVQQYSQWVVFRLGCSYPGREDRQKPWWKTGGRRWRGWRAAGAEWEGAGRKMLCRTSSPSLSSQQQEPQVFSWQQLSGFWDPSMGKEDGQQGCGGHSLCGRLLAMCLPPLPLPRAALRDQRESRGRGGGAESGHRAAHCPGGGNGQGRVRYLHSPDQCQAVTRESQGGHSPVGVSHGG